jgi:2-polyprenyl-3-methyl-5-hydroxy-6-metoxy-1,4-benzoquinol methylase
MVPMIAPVADAVANAVAVPGRRLKVLDIAAGHGMFGISVARRNPQAEIVAVDWKNVLEVAERNAARAGVQDRFRGIPGSVFEVDIESRYDLVIVANFFHCFDVPTNIGLLKKVWTAMKPGGLLATVELVPNDDRISPAIAASFSMNMLGATNGGDAYTFPEFDEMFRAAGFDGSRMQLLEPLPHALILTAR